MRLKTEKRSKKLALGQKSDKKRGSNLKKSAKKEREMKQEFSNYLASGH